MYRLQADAPRGFYRLPKRVDVGEVNVSCDLQGMIFFICNRHFFLKEREGWGVRMFSQEQSKKHTHKPSTHTLHPPTPSTHPHPPPTGTLLNSPSRHLQLCSKLEGSWDGRGNCTKGCSYFGFKYKPFFCSNHPPPPLHVLSPSCRRLCSIGFTSVLSAA